MANSATIGAGRSDGAARGAATAKPKRFWLLAVGVLSVGSGAAVGAKVADHVLAARGGAAAGWHGKIAKVVRGGGATEGGVTVDGVTAVAGTTVSSGARIVTDGRTEARVELEDGSTLLLDRSSDVALTSAGRGFDVKGGALVVDVAASSSAAPCVLRTATATVSATVARLALTALADRTSIEVLRGDVDVDDGGRASVHVNAGEEAVASAGTRLEVTAVNDLGDRVAFGERLGKEHDEDAEASVSGLGELRARRPGSTNEKDHALRLSRHDVRVRIVGSVARTEIDETFSNDTDNELEGLYKFPLPPGALIEKLSLDVDGKLVDGSFVDKAKAAAIWRGVIQHAAPSAPKPIDQVIWVPGPWRDPALLEWQTGGRTELKIFPIPKRGSRRVVLAYTQTIAPVAGVRRYDYPLPQATASDLTIDHASFDVQVLGADPAVSLLARGYELSSNGATKLGATMSAFAPSGDLVVEYALADRSADATAWAFAEGGDAVNGAPASSESHAVLALRPKLPRVVAARSRDQVIVIDGGRSMFGERFRRAARLAVEMTAQMDRRDRVSVLVCDLGCRALPAGFEMPGAAAAHDVDAFLATASPDGASDWVGAVRSAVAAPGRDGARDLRITLLSGGAPNAGYRSSDRLATEIEAALPDARAEIVTVPIGGDADVGALADVARGGGGVLVPYEPGEKLETAALDVLGATYGVTLRDVELTLPDGLVDAAPSKLSAIRAGGEALVAARLTGDHAHGDVVLRGRVGGDPFEARYPIDLVATRDAGNAFVPRLFAALRIADREREGGDAARAELVRLSQRYSVPSKFTSLLVLESEAMFHAFGIDRAARGAEWTGEQASTATLVPGADAEEDDEKSADLSRDSSELKREGLSGLGGISGGGSARATAPPAKKSAAGPDDGLAQPDAPTTPAQPMSAPPPPPRPSEAKPMADATAAQGAPLMMDRRTDTWRRPGRWMKRVFFRTAAVAASDAPVVATDKIASARAALDASPDERAKALTLVRLLTRDGSTDMLADVLGRWTARDPMDADAIAARADLLERAGDRAGALRVLGGVAATASGADAAKVLGALALAEERAGDDARACALRIGAAEATPSDVTAVAGAVACERASGHAASANRFLDAAKSPSVRDAVASGANKIASLGRSAQRVFGDVLVDATWDGGVDLDVAVVDPVGVRLGWASRARNVKASDCTSLSHEALAVASTATGAFVVEVVRAGSNDGVPVRGNLRITSLGQTRVVPFVLSGTRAQVARIDVTMSSRLVNASPGDVQAHMMAQ
jgi:hypothetical protein